MAMGLAWPMLASVVLAGVVLAGALALLAGNAFFLLLWRPVAAQAQLRPTLVLAVTGGTTLPRLFAGLAAQRLRPRRLLVVLEAASDPAAAVVARLAPSLPFPVEVLTCGTNDGRGQKSTALIAAAGHIGPADAAVVLLDADIAPPPDWLGLLLAPLENGRADVVTGGRWHGLASPGRPAGWRRHVMVWLERSIALGPRLGARRVFWGGSTAMLAASFRALDLPRTLDRALADDLALSAAGQRLGLRVLVRRALLLPTPPEGDEAGVAAFEKRQMQLLRLYCPWLWLALAGLLLAEMAGLPLLALALAGLAPPLAWAALAAQCLAGLARALAHDGVTRRLGLRDPPAARLVQLALGALRPLAAPLALPMLLGSAVGRRVRWRHVEYEVAADGRPRVLRRAAPGQEIA